jgi:UvrD/REP helicase N-terminal domain
MLQGEQSGLVSAGQAPRRKQRRAEGAENARSVGAHDDAALGLEPAHPVAVSGAPDAQHDEAAQAGPGEDGGHAPAPAPAQKTASCGLGSGVRGELPDAFKRCQPKRLPGSAGLCNAAAFAHLEDADLNSKSLDDAPVASATWASVRAAALQHAQQSKTAAHAQALADASNASASAETSACARLLQRLNVQQLSTVLAPTSQPLLVAAGTGNGKTSAMIARVAYHLHQACFSSCERLSTEFEHSM